MSLPQMSLSGAVIIFVIVVIRALGLHKLPKNTFLALWGIALARLLLPFSLASGFSVYSLLGRISAPLTYGVFRPVILMPKTTDWDDRDVLAYVLTHEQIHIRRFDAVTKLVLTAAHSPSPPPKREVSLQQQSMTAAAS